VISIDQAERFMWLNARLLDRLRFEYHFRGGDGARVVAAIRPYQNPDGGFGQAIEPDMRGPVSQPVAVATALAVLDDVGALDGDMLPATLGYLESITGPDGGLPFVLASVVDYPRAPWWQPEPGEDGGVLSNLNPTGSILAALYKNGIEHPWIGRATAFCWQRLDEMTETSPYEARSVIEFLDRVPDRARAEAAYDRLSKLLIEGGHVATDPEGGEGFSPLHYAARPDTMARTLVSAEVMDAYLDRLAEQQADDGGWRFDFPSWTPITTPEWRGVVTLESLMTLRDNGRL
jgi:hypothetical protein